MKKILHISKYYYPFVGGIEQTARDCVNALKNSYEQKVICFNHVKGEYIDIVDGIDVLYCDCQCKISSQSISLSYGFNLKKIIREFKPDYILFHYPNPFVAQFLLKYLNEKIKLIIYWHLDITKQKIIGKFVHCQNLKLIHQAYKIIATSPNYVEGSNYLRKVKEKCIIIPSCINEKRLMTDKASIGLSNKIKQENKGKIICLAVGRHVSYKGFEYLIRASKLLDKRFEIYIAGNGKLTKKLEQLASDDEKVHFLGLVDDNTLKAYFIAADIFCFPSITKNEAFGLALAEAMYFGIPVVTFTIPGSGVNYVSLNNITGIEVKSKSVLEYANALSFLAENSEKRVIFGKAGRRRVMENFMYDQFIVNINKFFQFIEKEIDYDEADNY